MNLNETLLKFLPYILSLATAWGVVRYKTDAHAKAIAKLEASKEHLQREVSRLDKELGIMKADGRALAQRLNEGLDRIDKAIAASETRVIAHVDFLVARLTTN